MSDGENSDRPLRKDCQYSSAEMDQIRPFKDMYKKATQAERLIIMKTQILPAMFNYWTLQGQRPTEQEGQIKTKELAKWVANSWRMAVKGAPQGHNWEPKRTELIWKTQEPTVMDKIDRLRKEKTKEMQPFIALRQMALSNILAEMPEGERLALDAEAKRIGREGNTEEEKRRLAQKFHKKRLRQTMQDHYRETGMLSVSFASHTRVDGSLVVDIYDHIAELTGVKIKSFEDMYEDEVLQMKGLVMKYVQAAKAMQQQIKAAGGGVPVEITTGVGVVPYAGQCKYTLGYTVAGFPVLPRPMNTEGWVKPNWETLYMDYMSCHYKLATGGGAKLPPYACIEQDQATFVKPEYLPRDMVLLQARYMNQEKMAALFGHIGHRQELYGAEQAFRFKSFKHKTKGILPARYPDAAGANNELEAQDQHDEPEAANVEMQTNPTAKPVRRRTQGRKAAKAVATNNEAEEDEAGGVARSRFPESPYVVIGLDIANKMISAGFRVPPPFNGPPMEPQHEIPRDVYESFVQQTTASGSKTVAHSNDRSWLDPSLELPTPRPSPMPMLTPDRSRPKPRPKPNPIPTRIQPTRRGKDKEDA